MREACAQVRKEATSRAPSVEKLVISPAPLIAVDRVSLRTDFDMDNPEQSKLVIANNQVA